MQCHCGTNNRAPRWTFTDPCKPEERPGAREESASPAWLAAPAMNARNITKVYIWRLDTVCGRPLYRKCHSHNTPCKDDDNTDPQGMTKIIAKYESPFSEFFFFNFCQSTWIGCQCRHKYYYYMKVNLIAIFYM